MLFQEYFSLFASAGYDIPTISRMWVLLLHRFIISHFKTTNPWEPPPGKVKKRNRLKDCKSEPTKLVSAYRNHHLEATAVMQADQNHFLKYLHQTHLYSQVSQPKILKRSDIWEPSQVTIPTSPTRHHYPNPMVISNIIRQTNALQKILTHRQQRERQRQRQLVVVGGSWPAQALCKDTPDSHRERPLVVTHVMAWVVPQGTTCIINPLIATWTFNSLGTQCPRCKRTSNCLTAHLLGGGEMCDCQNPTWTKPYYELFVRKPPGKYKRTDNAQQSLKAGMSPSW